MYNSDTELFFPIRVIPSLGSLKGDTWRSLVEKVSAENPQVPDQVAFVLMMVRLGGCVGCNADSFRAMRGCTACARQTIRRFRGPDQEMVEIFNQARKEVDQYLLKHSSSE